MSVELQIRDVSLAELTSRSLRRQLRATCCPRFSGFSIDHLDVVAGATVGVVQSSVEVRVPVDVFAVADGELFAAANGVPDGAVNAAARLSLPFRLQVTLSQFETSTGEAATRSTLTLNPVKPDIGMLAERIGVDPDQIEGQLRSLVPPSSIDLTPQLALLGVTLIQKADIVLADGVVAVRFDAASAPVSRLLPGQDWALFLDSPAVERLVRSKVEPSIAKRLPVAAISAQYSSVDAVPRVDLGVHQSLTMGIFTVRISVDLQIDLSLLTGPAPALRATIQWSLHVFSDLVPGFVEKIAESLMEDAFDPLQFGGTPAGDHTFVMDTALSSIQFLGVRFRYDTIFGSPAGMTIGGAVTMPGRYEPPFTLTVSALSGPTRIQLCSIGAQTGDGAPSAEPPTISDTTSFGEVVIDGCGAFCGVEVRSPEASFIQYLSSPDTGSALESATVRAAIPYAVAGVVTQPLTFIVRTARGVRFVNVGVPPKAVTDATGRVLNARDYDIPDCPRVVPLEHGRFGLGWGVHVDVFKPPPLEDPSWAAFVHDHGGLIVQLVRAIGLDAGELVRFRSATHSIDVIADAGGRAVLPVLLPLSAAVEPALLARADGRSLEGHVVVRTVLFERHVTLPGLQRSVLGLTRSGNATIATRAAGRTLVHTVTAIGVVSPPGSGAEDVALNPQPLPPKEDEPRPSRSGGGDGNAQRIAERAGIRGMTSVVTVPGFATSGVAVAIMADGTKLLLDIGRSGAARISGLFAGPIGTLDVAGGWAVAATAGDVAVFRVSTADPVGGTGARGRATLHA
ncbi:hypothetical protein AB0F72_13940 [Actinoplanes sp. NPDC023936]|uniref:hypothetical protein n=1 Tax=Actinoplanes sp. NPDC023936 TaxID=3154910 RepID=UPI003410B54C